MKRIIQKTAVFLMALFLIGSIPGIHVSAAGGLSISSSASKVLEGDTFTVTVSADSNYFVADLSLSVSGGTVVSGLGRASLDSGESTTAEIKLTNDKCKVTISGVAANYETETEDSVSTSVTVKMKEEPTTAKKEETTTAKKEETTTAKKEETTTAKKEETTTAKKEETTTKKKEETTTAKKEETTTKKKEETTTAKKEETTTAKKQETTTSEPEPVKSSNNKLSSLTVSEGSLEPEFSPNVTTYKLSLSGTTTGITVNATASDSKASVSGTGEKTLKIGNNEIYIVCKAEDGSKKTYMINAYVDETPLVYTTYQNKKLGVVRILKNIGVPDTFEETTVTLEGQEVTAFHSNQYQMTLIYLVDETGVKDFYMYDAGKGVTSLYQPVSALGKNFILYDLTEEEKIREHMTFQEIVIDDIKMNGWLYDVPGYENYAYIPVINEFGEKVIYSYEKTENTLQLYKEFVPPVVEEELVQEEPVEETAMIEMNYFYIAAGAAGILLLTTLGLLIGNIRLKKKNR